MENPRMLAADLLVKIEKGEVLSHLAVNSALERIQFAPHQDRAFFTRLCRGTLERQITLDYVLDCFSKTKMKKCRPYIRIILRMGVYQILFMNSVPDQAACNESVKLAKKRGFSRLSGFVNGVLRNVVRNKDTIPWPKELEDPQKYLSVIYSMPVWMISFFLETYSLDQVKEMVASFAENRDTTLLPLRTRGSVEELRASLKADGANVKQGALFSQAVKISDYDFLERLSAFQQGLCIVQDESSMLAGYLADYQKDQLVVDVCAAPGGKAIYAADAMDGTGRVIARDVSENKVEMIRENIIRTSLPNLTGQVADASVLDESLLGRADVVIADLPCSGLGIMGKKKEIRYQMTPETMDQLAQLQKKILENASRYVKPGGILMYSTCTINPEENEKNAFWAQKELGFHLEGFEKRMPETLSIETASKGYIQLLPGIHPCDGFFIARLRKES